MGKNQSASGLTNIIQYDNNGNVSFVSGSTTLMQISSSGAITTTGVISGSNALSSSYSLNSGLLNSTGSVGFATTASLLEVSSSQQQISASQQQLSSSFLILTASYTALSSSYTALSGSYNTFSGSNSEILTAVSSSNQQLSASYTALSGSYNTFSGSASTRVTQIEQVYATTGSNSFRATQSITGSLTVTGQIIAQTLNVQQVTSSIIYSSGSNNFGCDLNSRQTFTGSVLITGSLTIAGASSATSYSGTTIFGSTIACSPIGCFATSCATAFIGGTMSGTTIYGSTAVCSPVGKFTTCLDLGGALTGTSAVFSSTNTATAFIPSGATVPTNGMYLSAANTLDFATNSGNRLSIASTGAATFSSSVTAATKMSVGTSSTLSAVDMWIHSNSSTNVNVARLALTTDATGHTASDGSWIHVENSGLYIDNYENDIIAFGINATERMRITSCGKVGIIATDPKWLLEICCNTTATGGGGYPAISINNPNNAGYSAYYFHKGSTNFGGMELSNATCHLFVNTLCTFAIQTSGTERLRISLAGTSTFTTTENQGGVYVTSATDNTTIRVASTETGGQEWRMQSTGGTSGLGQGKLIFKVGGTETASHIPLTLTTDNSTNGGRVGIGTTTPAYSLSVKSGWIHNYGAQNASGFRYENDASGHVLNLNANNAYAQLYTSTDTSLYFGTSNEIRFKILNTGTACFSSTVCAPCFATISDYRMKSNIRPIAGLSIIMNTKPYKFEYNYDCSTSFGMIAHELQDTLPEAVFGQKDGEVMQGVDYMKLLPIAIKAIQEQQCKIALLESCLGIA